MLEYFAYKKIKKHRADKVERERLEVPSPGSPKSPEPPSPNVVVSAPDRLLGAPVLDNEDERFLERITSPERYLVNDDDDDDEGPPPPLPPRVPTPVFTWESDDDRGNHAAAETAKATAVATALQEANANKKPSRFAVITNIGRGLSVRHRKGTENSGLKPTRVATDGAEVRREETDITRVLDDLNLSAQNNKAFSLSADSAEMVRRFTLVLKDIVNGVPTAYDDLVGLLEDRDGILDKNYERLPGSLKKLVAQLPSKLSTTLAPELLAVAAEAQGLKPGADKAAGGGLKDAAKSLLTPKNLQEIVTKPGAVVGLLKGIVNVLKTRWPAFIGTNVLWSVALFLLLSALWYCHKRGRETRLEREATDRAIDADPLHGVERVEELPDDPQLPAARPAKSATK